jgi:adenylate cyclase
MSALWQGTPATKARIATGLVLFVYVTLHFLNIGVALISPTAADAFQDARQWITRSFVGSVVIYGALLIHGALALGKVAFSRHLRFTPVEIVQVGFGVLIPLVLATHVIFTRGSYQQFQTHDTVGYISALIWNHSDGWKQSGLLLIVWAHGCLGLHMWLRMTRWWRRSVPWLIALGTLIPGFALMGFLSEGRRAKAILAGNEDTRLDFFDHTNWPGPGEFAVLIQQSDQLFWASVALLSLTVVIYGVRQALRPRKTLKITYVGGPTISSAPGPTLLEMSNAARVPHTALCGGRGRCTTCRVVIQSGATSLPPPSPSEERALQAVGAPPDARLACQIRPTEPLTVYRMFQPDGRLISNAAAQGKEAKLAVLFLDMRGFTARTAGQLPYDVVFLLNRFFDAVVPPITRAGGTVDKYLGDGLLAVFELEDTPSSARAALTAASGIGAALQRFNDDISTENTDPVKIGLSLHLGTLVLGEIGAAGLSPRTLIGDTVNTASRLEAETKAHGVQALFSEPLLEAAGQTVADSAYLELTLRGVSEPLRALPIPDLTDFSLPDGL